MDRQFCSGWPSEWPDIAEMLRRDSKLDKPPVDCSVEQCGEQATIMHRSKPYCGKHALELLEAGEAPDRSRDLPRSITDADAQRSAPPVRSQPSRQGPDAEPQSPALGNIIVPVIQSEAEET